MKQTERVLDHIRKHGYITPLIAGRYGIDRLASRIYDLKSQGYDIKTNLLKDDMGKRYAKYTEE